KAVALLAYLAVARRTVSREELAALLWPEAADVDARGALRRTLSVLNTGLRGRGVVIDRTTVGIRESEVDVDLWRFDEALARVRAHRHGDRDTCPDCRAELERAAALDRGD